MSRTKLLPDKVIALLKKKPMTALELCLSINPADEANEYARLAMIKAISRARGEYVIYFGSDKKYHLLKDEKNGR